jgi:hypothetical protein
MMFFAKGLLPRVLWSDLKLEQKFPKIEQLRVFLRLLLFLVRSESPLIIRVKPRSSSRRCDSRTVPKVDKRFFDRLCKEFEVFFVFLPLCFHVCHPCTPSKHIPNTTISPSIASLGASRQGLMIPAHRRHHRQSSRRRRREEIAGESRERTMPATTNNTAAIAGARSRRDASGCRQTATHVKMTTWWRDQAQASRVYNIVAAALP